MNKIMDNVNDSQKDDSIKGGSIKLKMKLKFDKLPKEGVDLLGIAKKLSAKKFAKQIV